MMKKYIYLFILIIIVVLLINLYFNISIYKNQISFQRSLLTGQATASANEIENTMMKFENDVNALLFSNVLLDLSLIHEDSKHDALKNLELLFINYAELIKNIHIYDSNKNVLNLSFNRKDKLLIDPYVTQRQNVLQDRQSLIFSEKEYLYSFPVFKDNKLYANLVFTIDFQSFFSSFFKHYHHDKAFWQYMTDSSGNKIFCNAGFEVSYNESSSLKEGLDHEVIDFLKHQATINGEGESVFSAFAPLNILGIRFTVIFSMRKSHIFNHVINKVIVSSSITTALLVLFLLFLLGRLGRNLTLKEKESIKLSTFQSIFDNLPVGIMVLDQNLHTRIINQTAREMLFLKDNVSITGKNLTDRFMLSKDYYDNSDSESAFDSNQFVLYRHEGEEVSVFKKDMSFIIEDEELILSAFVDITPIEKARKYEAAANTAKSEFLAKMSHEIRTPMNGIIGMTEAFDQENLTPEQKDYLQIVKRSADLLLNLIDDILDFSKIEAGKMQLEEIPFKLREEVKLAVDLFRPIIEEKNIKLTLKINPDVPDNIIGDSFRLRQVLSNLISNAVKFTHKGEIVIGIQLEEEYNNNLTLLFYVEDTGVGIPHSKIESIFNSFTQAEESISRKYGGSGLGTTIAKQLVNLMHGEIWVESPSTITTQPNYPGSKFSFTIEVYSNEKQFKSIPTDKIHHLAQLNALLIASNLQSKQRLIRLFNHEKISYEFFEYHDAKQADLMNKLKTNTNSYQILFILDEPGMNGFKLVKDLQKDKLTDLFFLFMISSNHKPDNYIYAKRIGIDYYIVEPFEQVDLLQNIYDSFPNIEASTREIVRKIRPDISILVAEDNEINIRVAQTIFSNLGFNIDIAKNGNEAIEKIKGKSYDIVFMDLVMPERDGIQATVEIRALGFQMPIIAMTAAASSKSKSKAISSGMNDYIVKPVKNESIRNILLKWFA